MIKGTSNPPRLGANVCRRGGTDLTARISASPRLWMVVREELTAKGIAIVAPPHSVTCSPITQQPPNLRNHDLTAVKTSQKKDKSTIKPLYSTVQDAECNYSFDAIWKEEAVIKLDCLVVHCTLDVLPVHHSKLQALTHFIVSSTSFELTVTKGKAAVGGQETSEAPFDALSQLREASNPPSKGPCEE